VQAVAEAAHANERAMLVVPAFEVAQSPKIKATSARRPAMPRHKRQLGSMLKTGAASGFHVAHFPQVGAQMLHTFEGECSRVSTFVRRRMLSCAVYII
jgi:hypothetical protein